MPLCYGAFLGDFPDLTLRLGGGVELPLRAEDYVVCSMALCVILIQKASDEKGGETHYLVGIERGSVDMTHDMTCIYIWFGFTYTHIMVIRGSYRFPPPSQPRRSCGSRGLTVACSSCVVLWQSEGSPFWILGDVLIEVRHTYDPLDQ